MPRLSTNASFADGLASALDGASNDQQQANAALSAWVEWDEDDECLDGPFVLSARTAGVELASASTDTSKRPLSLALSTLFDELEHGVALLVELRWLSGARHLHLLRPLEPACLAFDGLVCVAPSAADIAAEEQLTPTMAASIAKMPPSYWWRSASSATLEVEALCAPLRPLRLSEVDRGLGVEIELLTAAGPGRPGRMTLVNPGCGAAIDAVAERCVAASPSATACLRRCLRWGVGDDVCIRPALEVAARRTVEACAVAADDTERAHALLRAAPHASHKTELRSPAPPCELSFADGAADEIRLMLQLVRRASAAATSVHRTHSALLARGGRDACDSGSAVHVHVNVRSADAAGERLSACELLRVVVSWVRFDLVTARFARAWMWREPSCAPMLATGPAFERRAAGEAEAEAEATAAREVEADGDGDGDGDGGGDGDGDGDGDAPAAWEWDVPEFFVRAHALLHSAEFAALGEAEQVQRIFGGEGSAAAGLGRYCSLNLQAVRKYGTLEMRRFHGTLDGDLIAHWAHFCVCFVEVFRGCAEAEVLLATPRADEALAALQAAQERATLSELMRLMDGWVDGATGEALVADAVGRV